MAAQKVQGRSACSIASQDLLLGKKGRRRRFWPPSSFRVRRAARLESAAVLLRLKWGTARGRPYKVGLDSFCLSRLLESDSEMAAQLAFRVYSFLLWLEVTGSHRLPMIEPRYSQSPLVALNGLLH